MKNHYDRICNNCNKRLGNHHAGDLECPGDGWWGPTKFSDPPLDELVTQSTHNRATTLPSDPKLRKEYPIATGVLDYFPDAIAAVAHVSFVGNQQHNPGEPLHWARGKSMDQDDTMLRHFEERGTRDSDGQRHSAKMAWRALAILQLEIEAEGKQ